MYMDDMGSMYEYISFPSDAIRFELLRRTVSDFDAKASIRQDVLVLLGRMLENERQYVGRVLHYHQYGDSTWVQGDRQKDLVQSLVDGYLYFGLAKDKDDALRRLGFLEEQAKQLGVASNQRGDRGKSGELRRGS